MEHGMRLRQPYHPHNLTKFLSPSLTLSQFNSFVGIDEVGRGSLAGPICAAAALSTSLVWSYKNLPTLDSKSFPESRREELARDLQEILPWGWGSISESIIDRVGIERANMRAMETALRALLRKHPLNLKKTLLLIDGNRLSSPLLRAIPHVLIIEGDRKISLIGAASLLAKTKRDALMRRFHTEYPMYSWENNKGYGTAKHRAALEEHGHSPLHRKTFLRSFISS